MVSPRNFVFLALYLIFEAQSTSQNDTKIVGGKPVEITDFPYQLSFRVNGMHTCGASIISENWALTASHCVKEIPNGYTFRAGSTYRNEGGTLHEAIKVVKHPKYDKVSHDYDYALVQISPPFAINNINLATINLSEEEPKPSDLLTVAGWGTTSSGGNSPDHLLAVDVSLVSREYCNDVYGNITIRMICAYEEGKDTCQGDSGGPLVNIRTGRQVGIVSFGHGCATPFFPGVYSNIADQREWIRDTTGI